MTAALYEGMSNPVQDELQQIVDEGIGVDVANTKENLTGQFSDHREYAREYVTNACDAGASRVLIFGHEYDETITIIISDNGHGMDRQGVGDYMTLFVSRKHTNGLDGPRQMIGQHGVGKLSAAAIPNLSKFAMTTSTGAECWRFEMGHLLDDAPVTIERVEPVPSRGTRFAITFGKKNKDHTVAQELAELRRVLVTYVRFLPIDIAVHMPVDGGGVRASYINEDWRTTMGAFGRSYRFELGACRYEVTLGLGRGEHEVYQSRVLVSARYNLLAMDLKRKLTVPHLRVRVDSPDFELPFGRHGLRNEEVLHRLALHLRTRLLPGFIKDAYDEYRNPSCEGSGGYHREFEAITLALLEHDHAPGLPWATVPLFVDVFGRRHSLDALRARVKRAGALYLESEAAVGVDYDVFDSIVLAHAQPKGAVALLKKVFSKALINLAIKDVVLEAPANLHATRLERPKSEAGQACTASVTYPFPSSPVRIQ